MDRTMGCVGGSGVPTDEDAWAIPIRAAAAEFDEDGADWASCGADVP